MRRYRHLGFLLLTLASLACSSPQEDAPSTEGAFSSAAGKLFTFEFRGEVESDAVIANGEELVNGQLLFTAGQLAGEVASPQMGQLELSNIEVKPKPNGQGSVVTYQAKLPVAWGRITPVTDYEFILPRNMSRTVTTPSGETSYFTRTYADNCALGHDITDETMWYFYRPTICSDLKTEDVVRLPAKVTEHPSNTTGKYPEYDRIWKDDAFNAVVIYGKDKAFEPTDSGISDHNDFINRLRAKLAAWPTTAEPVDELKPGAERVSAEITMKHRRIAFASTLPDGRKVNVTVLLVGTLRLEGDEFDQVYEPLTRKADLIIYDGHSGLGQNIRYLASRGDFTAGQYRIMFYNGCNTFSYVDNDLRTRIARKNGEDAAKGTAFLDIVSNSLPAWWGRGPAAEATLIDALLDRDHPQTYEQILGKFDESQFATVTGEEDNTFVPR